MIMAQSIQLPKGYNRDILRLLSSLVVPENLPEMFKGRNMQVCESHNHGIHSNIVPAQTKLPTKNV